MNHRSSKYFKSWFHKGCVESSRNGEALGLADFEIGLVVLEELESGLVATNNFCSTI